jgi:hypothetical protein
VDIWHVVQVRQVAQTTAAKQHANRAWFAVIDIAGTNVDVILKEETSSRLIKEILAVELASLLGVPHIPGWAASLDQSQAAMVQLTSNIPDPNDASRRLVFASQFSHGTPIAASGGLAHAQIKSTYLSHSDAVHILVFDELLGNCDRQYENLMEDGSRYLAFDHDKILFGDTAMFAQLPGAVAQPCMCTVSDDVAIYQGHTKPIAMSLAASWAGVLPKPIPILTDAVQINLLSSADEQAIDTYLRGRLPHLANLVAQHYP